MEKPIRRMLTMSTFFLTLTLITAACSGTKSGESDKQTLRFSSFNTETSSIGQMADWWMKTVTDRSNKRLSFKKYFSASLISAEDSLAAVSDGRVDVAHIAPPYTPAELPLMQIGGIPFVTTNAEALARTAADFAKNNDAFKNEMKSAGIKVVGFGLVPSATTGMKRPVETPGGFDGRKVRTIGYLTQAFQAEGASPVSMSPPDVYEAVQRGTVDGYTGLPFDVAMDIGLGEVAPYVVQTGLGSFTLLPVITVGLQYWNSLSSDTQAIMTTAGNDLLAASVDILEKSEQKACKSLHEQGGDVRTFSNGSVEAWKEEVRNKTIDKWTDDVGKQGISRSDAKSFAKAWLDKVNDYETVATYKDGLTVCAKG